MVQQPSPKSPDRAQPSSQSRSSGAPGIWLWLVILLLAVSLVAQTGSRRPALIRDTDTAEGKEEADAEKEKPFNPLAAEKSLKVGDYYLKRKNYDAAIQRYMEALQY